MGSLIVASLIVVAVAAPTWYLTAGRRARMRDRGDVIPAIAWLILCFATLSLMLADLVFLLFFGGGSSSLARASLMGAVMLLLWKIYRRQRARDG